MKLGEKLNHVSFLKKTLRRLGLGPLGLLSVQIGEARL